jgi:hypothetical protein
VAYVWAQRPSEFEDEGYWTRVTPDDWDEARRGFPVTVGSEGGSTVICAVAGIEPLGWDPGPGSCDPNHRSCVDPYEVARTLEQFVVGCSPTVFVPPEGTSVEATIEMTGRLTETLEIEARPLPSRAVPTGTSPTELRNELSPDVTVTLATFNPLTGYEMESPTTPFIARFRRLPSPSFELPSGVVRAIAARWAGGSAYSYIEDPQEEDSILTPLGVPRFVTPSPLSSMQPGEPITIAIDGDVAPNLIRMSVRPDGYRLGGTIPLWYVFARGDRREITLPNRSDPELALAPSFYRFDVGAEEREGFDFDSWTFLSLRREIPPRSSSNAIYARVIAGAP